jgi:hypothetical protein
VSTIKKCKEHKNIFFELKKEKDTNISIWNVIDLIQNEIGAKKVITF